MISVVIPTYNMADYLPTLWESIRSSGLARVVDEVLFVNDGSTDATEAAIRELHSASDPERSKVKCLNLASNQGRFNARYRGAKEARSERILFLDSRLELESGFGEALARLAPLHPMIVGRVDIDASRNVFCLYWDRSHRAIFRKHYRDTLKPLTLTPANFDHYLKGTTVFLCPRELFIRACEKFMDRPLFSDDTYLMREMVNHQPITVHPDIRIRWVPREDWKGFVWRIWNRGPQFIEYHVFERRGAFFWIILVGLAGLAALAATWAIDWRIGMNVTLGLVVAAVLSVAVFARSPGEALRMAPLHFAILLAFGLGALRGIWVNSFRSLGFYKDLRY